MFLVIDIGGTYLKYGLATIDGKIVQNSKLKTPKANYQALIEQIVAIYNGLSVQIKGLAISAPGTVDTKEGQIFYGGALPYLHKQNMKNDLADRLSIHVSIENDGKCAALAEYWKGATAGYSNSIVLVLGTGVGGGIIVNDRLLRGAHFGAGELSFVVDRFPYKQKRARMVGRSCSATQMVNQIAMQKGLPENAGERVFDYINKGDHEALESFKIYCSHIAVQILNLQYILDPNIIAIGGGISEQSILIDEIIKQIEVVKQASEFSMANPKVTPCKFKNNANLVGALYQHLLEYQGLVMS